MFSQKPQSVPRAAQHFVVGAEIWLLDFPHKALVSVGLSGDIEQFSTTAWMSENPPSYKSSGEPSFPQLVPPRLQPSRLMNPLAQNNKMNQKCRDITKTAGRMQCILNFLKFLSFAVARIGLGIFFKPLLLPLIKEFISFD